MFLKNLKDSWRLIKVFFGFLSEKLVSAPFNCRLLVGTFALFFSLIVNGIVSRYLDTHPEKLTEVKFDLILGWLSLDRVSEFFAVWVLGAGFAVFVCLMIVAAILENYRRVPFIQLTISLLILLRAFAMMLTPLKLPSEQMVIGGETIFYEIFKDIFIFKNDQFFSLHTSWPFLMTLLFFHKNRRWWLVFLFITFLFAFGVLKTHTHHSIDVFAAFGASAISYWLGYIFFGGWDEEKETKETKNEIKNKEG